VGLSVASVEMTFFVVELLVEMTPSLVLAEGGLAVLAEGGLAVLYAAVSLRSMPMSQNRDMGHPDLGGG
jgi:hypothetical protein